MQKLTRRQKELMEYASKGLSNKEIAEKMDVTPYCIKLQIHNILTKFNVSNRTKAILIYLRDYKGIDFGDFLF